MVMSPVMASFCVLIASCQTPNAQTPNAQAPTPNVKVTLVVILASETGDTIDPKLIAIAKEVQVKYPSLTNFALKSMSCKSLPVDRKTLMPVVDNKDVAITIKHSADQEKRVSLAVVPPDQGEIVYRSVCDKFLPIVTRYHTAANERLILAIRVQPCKGE
jgi:hypothetical protein